MRERAQQSWPALSKTAYGAAAAAFSRSASAKTTLADLPPSSSVTRLIVSAAPRITPRPTSVEPVKPIFATSGCSTSRWPTTRALADEDVDDAFGDAGLEDELGEPERGERRQLGGLEDDGVAAGERRAELPGGDVEREVPRDDQPDDAERLAEGHVDAAGDGDRLAVVLVDRAGVEVEDVGDHADLAARAGDRLADVLRLDPRELLAVLLDERREPPQQPPAVGGRNGAPGGERRPRASDRRVGLLDPGLVERRNRLLGRGVDDGDRHAVDSTTRRVHPVVWRRVLARDVHSPFWTKLLVRSSCAVAGRRVEVAQQELGRPMERTRMLEADRRSVAAPAASPPACCTRPAVDRVQVDVPSRRRAGAPSSASSRATNAVPEEMAGAAFVP